MRLPDALVIAAGSPRNARLFLIYMAVWIGVVFVLFFYNPYR